MGHAAASEQEAGMMLIESRNGGKSGQRNGLVEIFEVLGEDGRPLARYLSREEAEAFAEIRDSLASAGDGEQSATKIQRLTMQERSRCNLRRRTTG